MIARAKTVLHVRAMVALGLAITFAGGTAVAGHATWTASVPVSVAATTGTIGVTAAGTAALSTTFTAVPAAVGSSSSARTAAITVTNTGSVPLAYAITVTGVTGEALAGQIRLQVWRQVSGCATPSASATTGTLAAPPALPTNAASSAAGESFVVCAMTTFTGAHEAYVGQSVSPVIGIRGIVGSNWIAEANSPVTQAVSASWYQIKHLDSQRCVDGFSEQTAPGTDLIIWDCKALSKTNNQAWRFALTSGDRYRVVAGYTPLVWTADGTSAGSDVALYGAGAARQEWRIEQHGPTGYYRFAFGTSSRCLAFGANANETVGEIENCATSTNTNNATFRDQAFTLTVIP